MKKVLSFTLFFLSIGILSMAQQSYEAFEVSPLTDVLSILETKNQISFSYDNEKVENQYVSLNSGTYTLQQILQKVCDQVNLNFEFLDNKYILLSSKNQMNSLEYLCGFVKDNNTEEPITFATVYNESKTKFAETDLQGYFKIDLEKEDQVVFISYLGYEPFEIQLKNASNDPCQVYNIGVKSISFAPIILKEYLTDGISQTTNANTVVIEPDNMNVLPGSVEKDVLAAISFLPGITSHSESLDGIHIRGGTPDQNLILWDGIPMYHTSHFFGTISAFNPNIIDHVNVHRSGIGSAYGGRVSSVIDIHSKTEITDKFKAGAGFNLTHMHLDMDIPLWKNSSLMISTRRSITDIWNTPTFVRYAEKVFQGTRVEENNFNDPDLQFSDEYKFNDANVKWMMDYGKNKFKIVSLGALNSLNYKTNIEEWNAYSVELLDLRNTGANLIWERQWNPRYKSKLSFTNSEFRNDYDLKFKAKNNTIDPRASFVSSNSIRDGGFKWDNEWILNESQDVIFGYQFTENEAGFETTLIERQDTTVNNANFQNRLHALFGEYSLKLPKTLQIDIGLRYLYQEKFQNNYFEPRIAVASNVTDRLKLKVSTGKHFQFVSQLIVLNTNNLGLNNQLWVTAQNAEAEGEVTIPVIESNQWMGGFIYQKGNWTLDVEGYVKELAGITTLSNTFVNLEGQNYSSGNSRIRGIDFLLKKRINRYRSWISYSISKTKYEFPQISLDPIIASHDQTHLFKWVHLYKYKSWEFSYALEYRSGLPATGASLTDEGIEYDNPPNQLRLKRYFRMDGSIIYNFGSPNNVNGFIGFSIQNIRNRNNVLGRSYIIDGNGGPNNRTLLPINERGLKFTPNLSINVRMN